MNRLFKKNPDGNKEGDSSPSQVVQHHQHYHNVHVLPGSTVAIYNGPVYQVPVVPAPQPQGKPFMITYGAVPPGYSSSQAISVQPSVKDQPQVLKKKPKHDARSDNRPKLSTPTTVTVVSVSPLPVPIPDNRRDGRYDATPSSNDPYNDSRHRVQPSETSSLRQSFLPPPLSRVPSAPQSVASYDPGRKWDTSDLYAGASGYQPSLPRSPTRAFPAEASSWKPAASDYGGTTTSNKVPHRRQPSDSQSVVSYSSPGKKDKYDSYRDASNYDGQSSRQVPHRSRTRSDAQSVASYSSSRKKDKYDNYRDASNYDQSSQVPHRRRTRSDAQSVSSYSSSSKKDKYDHSDRQSSHHHRKPSIYQSPSVAGSAGGSREPATSDYGNNGWAHRPSPLANNDWSEEHNETLWG
ncbi:hypothetical protein C8Q75DRAFT_737750 [Abortiporus biennis]|nr:hypothetical protein C8Q75DRAFT_737750 [Abortiporus biennis]